MKRSCILCFSLIMLLAGCVKEEYYSYNPFMAVGNAGTTYESFSTTQLGFSTKLFVINDETGSFEQTGYGDKFIIDGYSYPQITMTYTITSVIETTVPDRGAFSVLVLIDETLNKRNAEFALRRLFKNLPSNCTYAIASFNPLNTGITVVGNGYTNLGDLYDQELATIFEAHNSLSGVSFDSIHLLNAIDTALGYINANAPAGNRNLLVFTSENDFYWSEENHDNLISRANSYGIHCNFVDEGGGFLKSKISSLTGGFLHYTDGSESESVLTLSKQLPALLYGGYSCYEVHWRATASVPVFTHNSNKSGYIYMNLSNPDENQQYLIPYFFYVP
ncbi:MAG: hypothetical protein V2A54_07650 [Bacteroidota bacterium]